MASFKRAAWKGLGGAYLNGIRGGNDAGAVVEAEVKVGFAQPCFTDHHLVSSTHVNPNSTEVEQVVGRPCNTSPRCRVRIAVLQKCETSERENFE